MVGFYLMIDTICHCFYFFFFYLTWSDGIGCHDLNFLNAEFQGSFSLSSFILIKPLFSSYSLSNIRVVLYAYLRLIFLLAVLIPACDSSNPAFCMTRSAQNLWYTALSYFPNLNQTVVPCLVLTVASRLSYRFLRRQVRWSSIPITLRMFHSFFWSTQQRLWCSCEICNNYLTV